MDAIQLRSLRKVESRRVTYCSTVITSADQGRRTSRKLVKIKIPEGMGGLVSGRGCLKIFTFNFQRESKPNRPMAVRMPSQLSRDFPAVQWSGLPGGAVVKNPPVSVGDTEMWVRSPGSEDP